MVEELLKALPKHKECLETRQGKFLFVVDWKDENNGGITFTDYDAGRAGVKLFNPNQLFIVCDKFSENALPIKKGDYSSQCECVLFPKEESAADDHWVLFIELKYAKNDSNARSKQNMYPDKMVQQIKETVKYFRDKQILKTDKIVYAIVSFPFLNDYNAWFDQNLLSDAFANDRIIMRATNLAEIISRQILNLH